MKKKLMMILAVAFLAGNTGIYAQVVNTDVPTEIEEEDEDFDDEDEDLEDEDSQEVLGEDEFAVTDEEGNE